MTYAAATEYAMRNLLDGSPAKQKAAAATGEQATSDAETGIVAADATEDDGATMTALSETLRELMSSNVSLTEQLSKAQSNANEASRNLLAATMQIKALPSADEVEAKEQVARSEGEKKGREEGRAERDAEIAGLGVFGYMSWRRSHKSGK